MAANKNVKKQQQTKPQKKSIQEKISSNKKSSIKSTKSSSILPWLFGIFVLIGSIAGIIGYDIYTHDGKFEASTTGKFLKDAGALPYVETVWFTSLSYSARGYKWAENNMPVYYNCSCKILKPYYDFSKDSGKLIFNFMKEGFSHFGELIKNKMPHVIDYIDQYLPGVPQKVQEISISTWNTVSLISIKSYHTGCEFFRTKVFVGNLSPENLSQALNETQMAAARYYSWFHEKVDTYAKIK